jgi:recombination protein RecA
MAEFDIMYGTGISKLGEIIDIGVDFEIINTSESPENGLVDKLF